MTSLIICLYGDPGVGKTPTAHTAVAPRLILDTENGSKFVRGKKIQWDPLRAPVPEPGDWDTCIVQTRDWDTFEAAYAVLYSGAHPFRSVVVDSVSELQKRCRDVIFASGEGQGGSSADGMNERRWGTLLIRMETVIREMRDLTMNPVRPLDTVVLVCLADTVDGKRQPLIQGGLRKSLPGFVDVIAHVSADLMGVVTMDLKPKATALAKDRTTVLPAAIGAPFDIESMRNYINNALEGDA